VRRQRRHFLGVGGCDGCVNLADPDNKGLEDIVRELEALRRAHFEGKGKMMSRADFWTLAGMVGVEVGIEVNNAVCFNAGDTWQEIDGCVTPRVSACEGDLVSLCFYRRRERK